LRARFSAGPTARWGEQVGISCQGAGRLNYAEIATYGSRSARWKHTCAPPSRRATRARAPLIMSNPFFDHPILNSPYESPRRHWELDAAGQPTQNIVDARRRADFITPIPRPKKRRRSAQEEMIFDEGKGLSTRAQQYDPTSIINEVRGHVNAWRALPDPAQWQVTPETARLLQHWRHHPFSGIRPFFCQVEAVETAIWLTEVAPQSKGGKRLLDHLAAANRDANPQLTRLALKLATGAGKTTVMAMIIAWQTINAARHRGSRHFTHGFLVCAPGLTIKDRLRVLQPGDPDSYYASRELVPGDMLEDVKQAKIVITNYHAFKLRERIELSAGGRALLEGRGGIELNTLETEGQMLQRVMPDLMGMKNILAINDEAHHCYREKPPDPDEEDLKGDRARKELPDWVWSSPQPSQTNSRESNPQRVNRRDAERPQRTARRPQR
jgi:type III restriction enzyme